MEGIIMYNYTFFKAIVDAFVETIAFARSIPDGIYIEGDIGVQHRDFFLSINICKYSSEEIRRYSKDHLSIIIDEEKSFNILLPDGIDTKISIVDVENAYNKKNNLERV